MGQKTGHEGKHPPVSPGSQQPHNTHRWGTQVPTSEEETEAQEVKAYA